MAWIRDIALHDEGSMVRRAAVAKDLSFGVAGDPHEQSLCFFGAPAVTAAENHNHGVLTHALRRYGIPVLERPPWRPASTPSPDL